MNPKRLAKETLILVVTLIIGFLLHSSVFSRIPIGVVIPNILLLLTSAFGFMSGGIMGMIFGFISGLLMDCFSPDYFGLNCLLYLFIGFLNGLFTRFFFGDDVRLPLVLVGISDIFYGLIVYTFLFLIRQRYDFSFYFMNIIMPEAVYTVLVFILLYFPLIRALRWAKKDNARRLV